MGTSVYRIRGGRDKEDHPHAYGDKVCPISLPKLSIGSSPRVWGQADTDTDTGIDTGSSPRVWGQGSYEMRYVVRRGIIPTRMGTRQEESVNG